MNGLEPIKSTRMPIEEAHGVEIIAPSKSQSGTSPANIVANAVADNFPNILELAGSLAEMMKMKVQSEAVLAKMEADRQMLIAETDAYCRKKEKDTEQYLGKLEVIRQMMSDYNRYGKSGGLSEEAFCSIITQIITGE